MAGDSDTPIGIDLHSALSVDTTGGRMIIPGIGIRGYPGDPGTGTRYPGTQAVTIRRFISVEFVVEAKIGCGPPHTIRGVCEMDRKSIAHMCTG
eukprot:1125945-Rhodomonas_salina.4